MKNAGKTEDWLIERASGVWRKDPLRAILELFPFGTDPKYSLVRLQEPWRSRYPNCTYGLDAWACEVCDRIALRVAEHDFDMVNAVDPISPAFRIAAYVRATASSLTTVLLPLSVRSTYGTFAADTNGDITLAHGALWRRRRF